MDKLNVLVTRVTGLMEQNRFVTDRQTDGQTDSYSGVFFYRKTSIILCFRNVFFCIFFYLQCSLSFYFTRAECSNELLSLLISASSVVRSSASFVRHNPFYIFDFIS